MTTYTFANSVCQGLESAYTYSKSELPLELKDINYRDSANGVSDGRPVLVLIHGLNDSLETWSEIVTDLASDYRVIRYDQRGHGASKDIGQFYTNSTMAKDLKALLDGLDIQSAHIVGHSMGGRTAIKFASLFPTYAKSVVVEDMHISEAPVNFEEGIQRAKDMQDISQTFNSETEARAAIATFYGDSDWTSLLINIHLKKLEDGRYKFDFKPYVGDLYETFALFEGLSKDLSNIKAPIGFLQADTAQGAILTNVGVVEVKAAAPNTVIQTVAGAGHVIHSSHSQVFVKFVRERTESAGTSQN